MSPKFSSAVERIRWDGGPVHFRKKGEKDTLCLITPPPGAVEPTVLGAAGLCPTCNFKQQFVPGESDDRHRT